MLQLIKPIIMIMVAVLVVGIGVYAMSLLLVPHNDGLYAVVLMILSVVGCVSGLFISIWAYDKLKIVIRKHKDKRTHNSLMVAILLFVVSLSSCERKTLHNEAPVQPEIDSVFIISVCYDDRTDFSKDITFEFIINADDKYDADRIFNQKVINTGYIHSYTIKHVKLWK
jgi:hypothetical protein